MRRHYPGQLEMQDSSVHRRHYLASPSASTHKMTVTTRKSSNPAVIGYRKPTTVTHIAPLKLLTHSTHPTVSSRPQKPAQKIRLSISKHSTLRTPLTPSLVPNIHTQKRPSIIDQYASELAGPAERGFLCG